MQNHYIPVRRAKIKSVGKEQVLVRSYHTGTCLVVQWLGFHLAGGGVWGGVHGRVSNPSWVTKIPHASRPKTKIRKQEQCCNEFNKDFKKKKHNFHTLGI